MVMQNGKTVISTHYRIVLLRIQVPRTDLMLISISRVLLFLTGYSLTFGAPLECSDPEFVCYQVLDLFFFLPFVEHRFQFRALSWRS